MKEKSTQQLEQIARDSAFYSVDKRYAALVELESRGSLSDELKQKKASWEEEFKGQKKDSQYNIAKNNPFITNDPEAPLLYTKRTIQVFSAIFSVLFGSVMLAINLRSYTANRIVVIFTVIAGSLLNFLLYYLMSIIELSGAMVVSINGLLGVFLTEVLWKKYIGSEVTYRKKPIVIPLIIGIAFIAINLYLLFITQQY